ncbi:MAG: pdhL, partial [Proteobacteria bacterium]|nr:pdhL [Pseudomonadota bacterium]
MAGRNIITVPDLGDFHDVEVIDVLVAAGDAVDVDTPLITLETDKATMDVPSTAAGRVAEVLVARGQRVSKGAPVVALEEAAAGPTTPAPVARMESAVPTSPAGPAAAPPRAG